MGSKNYALSDKIKKEENMQKTTVAILGAGIVGAFIFNTLVGRGVDAILLEKGEDVSLGATKANSGIIHAGYNCPENSLKAKFNVEGNRMYAKIAKRLHEDIKECGSLVVGDKDSLPALKEIFERGVKNGVKNMKILGTKELHALEPNLKENLEYALFAKDAKIISPYNFCISLCEEAIINGGKLQLNFEVVGLKKVDGKYEISNGKDVVVADYVINCTAEGTNKINDLIGDEHYDITFGKGDYMLFDKTMKGLVSRPIFPMPTKTSKGILVCPTVHGSIFLGPTLKIIPTYETPFSYESIAEIKEKTSAIVNNLNFKKVIKLYAGVRVKIGDDFRVDFSQKNKGFVSICGICSPGLSSAPAIAKYVVDRLEKEQGLKTKKVKMKRRKPYTNILKLSSRKLNALVKKDKNYGDIVCSCETISKGEILEVLNGPISPLTTDGVKRRLRTTMGHCQGAFCYSGIIKIMSDFYHIPEKKVEMRGDKSLVVGDIKEGGIYENS